MAWWTVHKPPGAGADAAVFVREGFNPWAFLFPLPWLVVKGMWIVLLLALSAQFLIWVTAEVLGFNEVMSFVFTLAINLILGFEGNSLLRWTQARRGFEEVGLVHGDNLEEAEVRYFTEADLGTAAPDPAEPPNPLSPRWKSAEPDFLFPGFGRS